MHLPIRKRLSHERPAGVDEADPIFLTLCGQPRNCNQFAAVKPWNELVRSCEQLTVKNAWRAKLLVAMPDHIHLIATIPRHVGIDAAVGQFKALVARGTNIDWQSGFFDHRLRNRAQFRVKWNYVMLNPVRAGLCDKADDWLYQKTW